MSIAALDFSSDHALFRFAAGSTPTAAEVRSAYLKLALKYHPDKNQDPRAGEVFVRIGEAFERLTTAAAATTTTTASNDRSRHGGGNDRPSRGGPGPTSRSSTSTSSSSSSRVPPVWEPPMHDTNNTYRQSQSQSQSQYKSSRPEQPDPRRAWKESARRAEEERRHAATAKAEARSRAREREKARESEKAEAVRSREREWRRGDPPVGHTDMPHSHARGYGARETGTGNKGNTPPHHSMQVRAPDVPAYDAEDPDAWFAKLSAWKERFRAIHEESQRGQHDPHGGGADTAVPNRDDAIVSLEDISDLVAVLRGGQRFQSQQPIGVPQPTGRPGSKPPHAVYAWLSGAEASARNPLLHMRDAGPGSDHRPGVSIPMADPSLRIASRKRKAHVAPQTVSISFQGGAASFNLDAPDPETCDIWCTSLTAVRDAVAAGPAVETTTAIRLR